MTPVSFSLEGKALPPDAQAVRFEAIEAISEPYQVVVELSTADPSFVVADCLRTRLALIVTGARGEARVFDGVVDEARFVRIGAGRRGFELRLRPALAALAHREGCRIFQDKSIVEVVQQVLDEAGFGDKVEWRIRKHYDAREFVVQYRETHLSFVSRLLEENGLFYYFRHEAAGHTLIIADDAGAFGPEPGLDPVSFSMAHGASGAEPLPRLTRRRALRASGVHLLDYDFERPQARPSSQLSSPEAWPMPYFEYPAGFTKGSEGARLAEARMRELRADADTVSGESRAVGLMVGVPFTVEGAAEDCLNGAFVVTHLMTRGQQAESGGGGDLAAENQFRAIPAGAPFAAPRKAKKPRVRGVETAVVTGSSKQEQAIHVDKYGRIKVRFHWDREGQHDHTSSCWVRVCQPMMGGAMILPRVGWEVMVAFLDGDPDRPVVMGRVYNAEKVPPLSLPASKTSGSLKSMSSPGAGGHNELTMGDSAGSQGMGMHAQKDLNVTVGNDKVESVGADESNEVSVNASSSVKGNDSTTISGNQTVNVGAVLSQNVSGAQSISVGGNDTSNAISNDVEKVGGARSYSVGGNQITISNGIRLQAAGAMSLNVGALELSGSIGSINDRVAGALKEHVGAVKVQLAMGNAGEHISGSKTQTYAAAELHLTKGGLSFKAGGGVTQLIGGLHYQQLGGDLVVQAPVITLVGGVGVFKAGGSELKLGGAPVVIKGDAITIKGALAVKMGSSLNLG